MDGSMDLVADTIANAPLMCTCGVRFPSVRWRRYFFGLYAQRRAQEDVLNEVNAIRACCRRTFMAYPAPTFAMQALSVFDPTENGYREMVRSMYPERQTVSARVTGRGRCAEPHYVSPPFALTYPSKVLVRAGAGEGVPFKAFTLYDENDWASVRLYEDTRDRIL